MQQPFWPRIYCLKALELITALHDEKCVSKYQHKDDSKIQMTALNFECLKSFTKRELLFFKIIDVRDNDVADFSTLSFFSDKQKTNPIRDVLFVAL